MTGANCLSSIFCAVYAIWLQAEDQDNPQSNICVIGYEPFVLWSVGEVIAGGSYHCPLVWSYRPPVRANIHHSRPAQSRPTPPAPTGALVAIHNVITPRIAVPQSQKSTTNTTTGLNSARFGNYVSNAILWGPIMNYFPCASRMLFCNSKSLYLPPTEDLEWFNDGLVLNRVW